MIRRIFLLTLPIAVAVPAASALAQYAPPPPGSYRSGPPPGYYDNRQPPAFWDDDDEDDRPVRRAPQMTQNPPDQSGAPTRGLPYPDDSERDRLSTPGFVPPGINPPNFGHQLDQQGEPRMATPDPDAIRPPGAIGAAPSNPPGTAPQVVPPSASAALPPEDQPEQGQPKELPANLKKQLVEYVTKEPAGTIIIDTPNTYLYLVLGGGSAMRYGIGVGREGFTWTGTERISRMKEWPDWFPPSEMIERQPYLPRMMAGGPGNPLGARALYLGKTLYRIHGTNQPSTIGSFVSSGCIRLLNEDVEDLYSRVQAGTRVVVLPGKPPEHVANTGANTEPANPMAPPPRSGAAISSSPLPPAR